MSATTKAVTGTLAAALAVTSGLLLFDIEDKSYTELVQHLDDAEAAIAAAQGTMDDLGLRLAGDLDGDGDIDDADMGILFSNYTGPGGEVPAPPEVEPDPGPSPSPEPVEPDVDEPTWDEGFDEFDLSEAALVERGSTLADLQRAVDEHDLVAVEAGSVFLGELKLRRWRTTIFAYGEGDRPQINAPAGSHGISLASGQFDLIHVQGLELNTVESRADAHGINVRLNGKEGKYVNKLRLVDVKVNGFDSGFQIVDDWSRVAGDKEPNGRTIEPGAEGRIKKLEVHRCILNNQFAPDDSHSISVYVEGVVDAEITQTVMYKPGWATESDKNKKSHCIYAQSYGGTTSAQDCWFLDPAANAAQFRAGSRYFRGNVISGAALGPWFTQRFGPVEDNVLIDQVDITTDDRKDWRGHGFVGNSTSYRNNLAARRSGSLQRHPAFKDVSTDNFSGNVAVAWAVDHLNFEYRGRKQESVGTNVTVREDPGIPRVTAAARSLLLERPLGRWDEDVHGTENFRDRCWKAL